MKKLLSLILLLSFVIAANVALTGCGGSDSNKHNDIINPAANNPAANPNPDNPGANLNPDDPGSNPNPDDPGSNPNTDPEVGFNIGDLARANALKGSWMISSASSVIYSFTVSEDIGFYSFGNTSTSEAGLFSVSGSQITFRKYNHDANYNYTGYTDRTVPYSISGNYLTIEGYTLQKYN
jgi:hypothetical protein